MKKFTTLFKVIFLLMALVSFKSAFAFDCFANGVLANKNGQTTVNVLLPSTIPAGVGAQVLFSIGAHVRCTGSYSVFNSQNNVVDVYNDVVKISALCAYPGANSSTATLIYQDTSGYSLSYPFIPGPAGSCNNPSQSNEH